MENEEKSLALLSRSEAAQIMSISQRTLDCLVARKSIRAVRVGRRVLIPVRAIEEFIHRQTTVRTSA